MSHNKIVAKKQLSENVFTIEVEAKLIAAARKPGQFVIVGISDDYGERIPLTIAGTDVAKGTITLVFQRVGKTTSEMADLNVGDELSYIAGPLGRPTHVEKLGTVVCVGGGIGNAPLLPIATAMKEAGNKIISIIGARTKELLIFEDEFAAISDELIVVTDDGSHGRKALVTEPLEEFCGGSDKPDKAIVIGPAIMMKFCCMTTAKYDVPTEVSLNTIMIDGTGMCGGCRVTINREVKFACVDGPEFDGTLVDWEELLARIQAYDHEQRVSDNLFEYKCRMGEI